jgi:starch phosphorylase
MANQQPVKFPRPSVTPKTADPALVPEQGVRPAPPLVTSDAQSEHLKRELFTNLWCVQGKDERFATPHDYYTALAYSVRNELLKQRIHTAKTYSEQKAKVVYYLSAEFLMGRHLGNGLINLGLYENHASRPGRLWA